MGAGALKQRASLFWPDTSRFYLIRSMFALLVIVVIVYIVVLKNSLRSIIG
jgi:hypothetical protein